MHICTHARGWHRLWTNMTPLEQDNNNGINGIPGFSWFLIYLRWRQEHRTKVTVSIMQSHNATDLSNNTAVESWQINVWAENIWNTSRFTPVNQPGNNDGQLRINRPQLNFGIPSQPERLRLKDCHMSQQPELLDISRFIWFQPLLSPPRLETSLFVLTANAQGKRFVCLNNLFLCNEYVYVATLSSLYCTETWNDRCFTMFSNENFL